MRRLRRLYEEKEKMPGIGRYPMGPTINNGRNEKFFFTNLDTANYIISTIAKKIKIPQTRMTSH